jgi:SCY1-like protein 1
MHCTAYSFLYCLNEYLSQVRHPNVLAFKETLEVEEKGATVLYVITEAVAPLTEVLQQLDIEGHARYG